MSDITLYSGLYQQISEYGEQVDKVLIALVNESHDQKLFQKFIDTLNSLKHPSEDQLITHLVAEMIFDSNIVTKNDLEILSQSFRDNVIDDVTREIVEKLARSLELERTKTMARIRGNRH